MATGEFDLQGLIDEAWERKDASRPSRRLGASSLGGPCDRALFLKFHWVVNEHFKGRLLRLFDLGKREEDVMVENLKKAGIALSFTGKDQVELKLAPHVVSYPDGLITHFPPIPGENLVLEIKTMNTKDFEELKKHGVKKTQREHYAQMQLEMKGMSDFLGKPVRYALYVVLNKNDSRIYCEIVEYDEDRVKLLLDRADNLVGMTELPPPLTADPNWYICKTCNYWNFCHLSHESFAVNCRTCAHSTPMPDGNWHCAMYQCPIPIEAQGKTNTCHCFNPSLVPYTLHEDMSTQWSACYEMPNGELIWNGFEGVPSTELWRTGRPQGETETQNIPF